MDTKRIAYLSRYVDNQTNNKTIQPVYEIGYKDKVNDKIIICLILNGSTGEILYQTKRYWMQAAESVFDEYVKSLAQ